MKFLRSIFTNSIVALICTMLAVFGVGMGLLTLRDGQIVVGILYVVGGVAIFIVGKRIGDQGDDSQDDSPRRRHNRW